MGLSPMMSNTTPNPMELPRLKTLADRARDVGQDLHGFAGNEAHVVHHTYLRRAFAGDFRQ